MGQGARGEAAQISDLVSLLRHALDLSDSLGTNLSGAHICQAIEAAEQMRADVASQTEPLD